MSNVIEKLKVKVSRLADKISEMDDFERGFVLTVEKKLSVVDYTGFELSFKQKKLIDKMYFKYFNSWTID